MTADTDTRWILVVDDDRETLANVQDLLEDHGYRVDVAADGPQALRLASRTPYDLAILDFKMPGMDGAELCSQLNRVRPQMHSVLVTAYAGTHGIERATAAGVWRIVRKPVDMEEMFRLIAEALPS